MEDAKSSDLQQQMAQLEATLDALPVSQREMVMTRLRDAMLANGEQLSAEDDNVCRQFAEGAVSVRQVQEHFGNRMWYAFGLRPDSDDAA
jgi:hypothetical protein